MSIEISPNLDSLTDDLSSIDHELIYQQCLHQNATTPEEIACFTRAYAYAKNFAHNQNLLQLSIEGILDLENQLAILTDPNNKSGYRSVPALFESGNKALDPELILEAIQKWAEAYANQQVTPIELYKEFESIHPRKDGNGRVGDLFWKIAEFREQKIWPETLPPQVFGLQQTKIPYQSSFGEVED